MSEDISIPEIAPMPELPPVEEMKAELHQTVIDCFAALLGVVKRLPIHPEIKRNAMDRYSEGNFWVHEGIAQLQFLTSETESTSDNSDPDAAIN